MEKKALMRASAMKSKFPSFLPQFPSHPSELNLQMSYISFQKPLSANKCLSLKKKKKWHPVCSGMPLGVFSCLE